MAARRGRAGRLARATLAAAVVATARAWTSLFATPGISDAGMYIAPEAFNHSLIGPVGLGPGPSSHWYAAQWNNPAPLQDARVSAAATVSCPAQGMGQRPLDWSLQSATAAVCRYGGATPAWRVAQNGDKVPCGTEDDLFLAPVGGNYPGAQQGMRRSPPLASMSQLRVTMTASLDTAAASVRCGADPQCGPGGKVDYGYAVLGIVCSALDAPGGGQTLFYQVLLADTRQHSPCAGGQACSKRPLAWYFEQNPYGASDTIANFGAPCLEPRAAAPSVLEFDALPQLRAAVEAGPPGGNGFFANATAWSVTGVYLGVGLQGSTSMTLDVADFDVSFR